MLALIRTNLPDCTSTVADPPSNKQWSRSDALPSLIAAWKMAVATFSETLYSLILSERRDSNSRPPAPKAGALTGLRYTPNTKRFVSQKRVQRYAFFQ